MAHRPSRPRVSRFATARWRRLFGNAGIPTLALAPQVPAVIALGLLSGSWLLSLVPAALLSAAFFTARSGYRFAPRGRTHLYVGLWPFFAWWATCLVFLFLAPVALVVALLSGLTTDAALAGAGALAAASGLRAVHRTPRVNRLELALPGLPRALDGYRIAQISDLHCGLFAPERRVRDWVRRVNRLRPDAVAITGDLITSGTDYIVPVSAALGELRGRDGVFACMGNHDYFGAGEPLVTSLEDRGVRVLRNQAVLIDRPGARLAIAGVDDTWSRRANLERALAERPPGTCTVLLAHDPDVFPLAAAAGVELTLSGHTHGGQFAIPFLARRYNLANLVTRFSSGLYRDGRAALYVNRGIGTSGPPVRLGTRAEIALITLRAR